MPVRYVHRDTMLEMLASSPHKRVGESSKIIHQIEMKAA